MNVAIITGASQGLGLATARALTSRGWAVVIDARREGPRRARPPRNCQPGRLPRCPATSPTPGTGPRWSPPRGRWAR